MKADTSSLLRVADLRKRYLVGTPLEVEVLRGFSFEVGRGEFVAIVGQSGSGKSTLLNILGALDQPTSGLVCIDGVDISGLDGAGLARLRNEKIGFVFQFFNLIPTLTALENVALPIQFARTPQFNPTQRSQELLTRLELDDRLYHRPQQLSGGQQQRVAIARALANNPPLLLTDEPTGNLNTEAGELVMSTLRRARDDFSTTVVIVTHDPDIAAQTDRSLHLVDGRLV